MYRFHWFLITFLFILTVFENHFLDGTLENKVYSIYILLTIMSIYILRRDSERG